MKKVLVGILAFVGALSILGLVAIGLFGVLSALGKPGVPRSVILEADFGSGVIEAVPEDAMAQWMFEDSLTVRDVVDALDEAAGDRRVEGFVARIGGGGMGLAHLQEIRDAVIRFRASGKPAIAYADTFGEFGPGNGGYYLASAFDEIYLQPSGDIGLTGLMYESMFVRGLLEKLDVVPRLDQRHEFKNAMNMYTERSYTPAHREAMQVLVDSQFDQMVAGIAADRGFEVDEVRRLFDEGPYLGAEASEAGLVDGLAYRDEVYEKIRARAGEDADLLFVSNYLERAGRPNTSGETVALIHGYGTVARGPSRYSPVDGSIVMGSDTVTAAFRAAIRDRKVKAILFRVDSPGGSYVASDTIWRETLRAKEAGKPVIVSMGNVAGSGGYFVAMHADKIVAQPGTITASIGVLGGKLLTRKFWAKWGITWDEVHTSENSDQWTGTYDYDESGFERFEASLDRIYEDFTSKVADGRSMELADVQRVAKGRIWTGQDAKEIGLIDELGGYETALRLVREAIGVDEGAPLRIKKFPRKRTSIEMLLGEKPDSSEKAAARAFLDTIRTLQPVIRSIGRELDVGAANRLEMAPVGEMR